MAEKWETVTRSSKKSNSKQKNVKPDGKERVNKYADAVTRPLIEEKSAFEALAERNSEQRKSNSLVGNSKSSISGDGDTQKAKSATTRPAKKDGNKKSSQKPTLQNSLASITGEQFEDLFARMQQIFKDNPLPCLKELTSQLNSKLDGVQVTDPVYADKPEDFPSCLLSADVKKVFVKSIKDCSPEHLQMFLNQLLQSIMSEMGKGLSVYGYHIVAQILARQRPDLFCINLQKHLELIVTHKNSATCCLAVMWTLGQGGTYDFRSGLKVWAQLMLPLLGVKTLANYAVSYLGAILQKPGKKIEQGFGVLEMKDYFLLLDGVFTDQSNLSKPIQKTLREYYPVLKELAFGKNKAKTLRKFFPSFLARLSKNSVNEQLQDELLSNIVQCLAADSSCYDDWVQIYSKHLQQSNVLLKHLANSLYKGDLPLNISDIHVLVTKLNNVNSSITKSTPDLQQCKQTCQNFGDFFASKAADSRSATTGYVIFLCIVGVALLVTFDSYQNGCFKASKTYGLMKSAGIDGAASIAYEKLSYILSICSAYLSKNVPKWTETCMVYLEPLMEMIWKYTVMAVKFVTEVSEPLRSWLAKNVPVYVDWIIMHPTWSILYVYVMEFWSVLEPHVLTVSKCVSNLLNQAQLAVAKLMV